MRDSAVTFIAGAIYLAILYMLVRPGSNGPTIINNIFSTLSDLVRGSVGYTFDSSTGKWTPP
jgi:hypothetical protein